jgi:pimeloyl-ACP methyl ester carboxylesterase
MSARWRVRRIGLARAALLALAAPAAATGQGRTLQINGEHLYYEVAGQGPPLVLIHGWSLNLRMWDPQIAELSRHFRVIRYDRRGFGKSTGNEDISWDAADLNVLLDSLGVSTVRVLGMSQGGRVALQFARSYPSRVASLILQGTPPPDGFGLPWSGADRLRFEEWASLARTEGLGAFQRAWSAHPMMAIPAGHPEARNRIASMLSEYKGDRLLHPAPPSGPGAAITMGDLPRIEVPTLVLAGETEVPFLQIVARALAYYIPNARLSTIPGGGHMVNLIEPGRYSAAIIEFLATVDRARK